MSAPGADHPNDARSNADLAEAALTGARWITAARVLAEVLLFVLQMDPRLVIHEINFESFAFYK